MIPVKQTMFFQPDEAVGQQRGNCLTAVVASLLDVPIQAVPNFVEADAVGGPNWWLHLWSFVKLMGYRLCSVSPRNPPHGYYTVAGLSVRATDTHPIHHICIYRDGHLVHDPHPAGGGLLTEETCWYLTADAGAR